MHFRVFITTILCLIYQRSVRAQILIQSSIDSSVIEKAVIVNQTTGDRWTSDKNGIVIINSIASNSKYYIYKLGFDSLFLAALKSIDTIYLKGKVTEFEPFVYTGNPNETKRIKDDISNVKIIGINDIKSTASQNLADILKYQPNITINNDPALGASVSVNGMSGQNIKILKNGAQVTGSMNGNIDVSQININNVEQIEVIEGPMSLLYGSNALAGTINVISKIPEAKTSAFVKSYTESSGIYNVSGGIGTGNKHIRVLSSFGRNFFDGWSPKNYFFYSPANNLADTSRQLLWKPRQQLFGDLAFFIPIAKKGHIKFNHDILDELIISKGFPQLPYYEFALDDYFRTIRNTNSFELNLTGKKWKHNVLGSASFFYRTKNTYFKDLTTTGIGNMVGKDEQDTTKINSAQLRYLNSTKLFKTISVNAGIDYNFENLLGKRIENNNQSISSLSFIAIASYTYKKHLDVKIGARQTIHSLNHIPTIPSMSIRWKINPKYELKLNVAKAYRTPGIKELYLYFVDINHNIKGNPDLLSESSINYNINVSRKDVIKKKFPYKIQCNLFHNRFKNLISLAALNLTEYTYVNIGKSIISGINTDLSIQFKKFDFSVKNSILSTSNNLEIADIPNYFNTVNYSFISTYKSGKNKALKVNFFVNRFGKTPVVTLVDNKPFLAHNAGYWMIDMSSLWPIKFKKTDLNFSLGMRNLANVSNIKTTLSNGIAHQSSSGQRMISTGRTIFFGLDIKI